MRFEVTHVVEFDVEKIATQLLNLGYLDGVFKDYDEAAYDALSAAQKNLLKIEVLVQAICILELDK